MDDHIKNFVYAGCGGMVSRTVTAPLESPANLPVSNERVLSVPEIGPDTEMASAIVFFYSFGEAFSP